VADDLRGALIAVGDYPMQPGRCYKLGKLRFEHQLDGRWTVSNGTRGVCNYRTPLGAWLGLRRFIRSGSYGPPQ
jgi:hypothetical protein